MNMYLLQILGIVLAAVGGFGLLIYAALYGTPATSSQRRRTYGHHSGAQVFSLPISVESIVLGMILMIGLGILALSRFNTCEFVGYWWPEAPSGMLKFICVK